METAIDVMKQCVLETRSDGKASPLVGAVLRKPDGVIDTAYRGELHGRLTPTGFGLLLFGSELRTTMPQAGLLGSIHCDDGTEGTKDFDGPQVLAPDRTRSR